MSLRLAVITITGYGLGFVEVIVGDVIVLLLFVRNKLEDVAAGVVVDKQGVAWT